MFFWESEGTAAIESATSDDDEAFTNENTPPKNCIDGDPDTLCESTKTGVTLTVKTKETENISGVEITINPENRDALLNATVFVDGKKCATITEIPKTVVTKLIVKCEGGPIQGSTVTIKTAQDKKLSLKELEIVTAPTEGNNIWNIFL